LATKKPKKFKNRRILITAGPTWVPVDSVRVISNIATGQTGILLADKLIKSGAKVTLLLGPSAEVCPLNKKIKLIRFKFFDELKSAIIKEVAGGKYDVVIHSAAVADYRPQANFKQKVKSGIKKWNLCLVPTPKLINLIKKIDRDLFLVGFKFEPKTPRKVLITEAKSLIARANLDLAVANTVYGGRYCAYLVNNRQVYGPVFNKKDMARDLAGLIGEKICKS
jgi:phosphopantothenoylcysteine decarboxylase/phosphopantothenate--cysteine ligase